MKFTKVTGSEAVLLSVVMIQVFLLLTFTGANSYVISRANFPIATGTANGQEDLIISGFNLLIGFLAIKEVGLVSANEQASRQIAESLGVGCCAKRKSEHGGGICVEISDTSHCEDAPEGSDSYFGQGVLCESFNLCRRGVFYDEEFKTCSIGRKIEEGARENSRFYEGKDFDEVDECKTGCCTIGLQKAYYTRGQCEKMTGSSNVEFDLSVSEEDCKFVDPSLKGACVIPDGSPKECIFTTQRDCTNKKGEFNVGSLCTNPELGTRCERTDRTTCNRGEGGDGKIYFLDSCNNMANVYDSGKVEDDDYWKSVKTGNDLCNDENNNVFSAGCGNCDADKDSSCIESSDENPNPEHGRFICGDNSCVDEDGKKWQSGESWCIYEGHVGESRDVVGSSHRMRICRKGSLIFQETGGSIYRREICGNVTTTNADGETFSHAQLRPNMWKLCLGIEMPAYYDKEGKKVDSSVIYEGRKKCEAIPDCRVQTTSLGDKDKKIKIYTASFQRTTYESKPDDLGKNPEACMENEKCVFLSHVNEGKENTYLHKGEKISPARFEEIKQNCLGDESLSCLIQTKEITKHTYKNDAELDGMKKKYAERDDGWEFLSSRFDSESYSSTFHFDRCVPKYPPGFEFWNSDGKDLLNDVKNKEYCEKIGTVPCPFLEKRTLWFWESDDKDWDVEKNGECLENKFAVAMNDYCRSFGDCGSYVNVKGDYYKKGYDVSPNQSTNNFKKGEYSPLPGEKIIEYKGYASPESGGLSDPPTCLNCDDYSGDDFPLGYLGLTGENIDAEWKHDFGSVALSLILGGGAGFGVGVGLAAAAVGAANIFAPGLGLVIVIVVSLVGFIAALLGLVRTEYRVTLAEFTCKAWQVPAGVESCNSCNSDPKRPCNEYKCRSLGKSCEIAEDTEDTEKVCYSTDGSGKSPPVIKFKGIINDENLYGVKKEIDGGTEKGVRINSTIQGSKGNISESVQVNFSLFIEGMDDDRAKCIYTPKRDFDPSIEDLDYPDATEISGGFHKINHDVTLRLLEQDKNKKFKFERKGGDPNKGEYGVVSLYVRCMNLWERVNTNAYEVSFFVKWRGNIEPALISGFEPENGSYLVRGVDRTGLSFKTNVPVKSCKWSKISGQLYEQMPNNFACDSHDGTHRAEYGCRTPAGSFLGLDTSGHRNDFYVRCKTVNDIVNPTDKVYTLFATQNELGIQGYSLKNDEAGLSISGSDARPRKFVFGGGSSGDSLSATLGTRTSGGIQEGNATCKYKFLAPSPYARTQSRFSRFLNTGDGPSHTQVLTFENGSWNLEIFCEDDAVPYGNNATGKFDFVLSIDGDYPEITRVSGKGNSFEIRTNEKSQCYYHTNSSLSSDETCSFELNESIEGISKTSGDFSDTHRISRDSEKTYYLRCKDYWNQSKAGCNVILSSGDFV